MKNVSMTEFYIINTQNIFFDHNKKYVNYLNFQIMCYVLILFIIAKIHILYSSSISNISNSQLFLIHGLVSLRIS
jgi:hypothetical protein